MKSCFSLTRLLQITRVDAFTQKRQLARAAESGEAIRELDSAR